MPVSITNVRIDDAPLVGAQAVHIGSRIVIWDHHNNKAVFVGKLTRIIDEEVAFGENYIYEAKAGGKLTQTTRLPFASIGLTPLPGTKEDLHPRYRTYALPSKVDAMDYELFQVAYKTPGQPQKRVRRSKKPPPGGTFVEM